TTAAEAAAAKAAVSTATKAATAPAEATAAAKAATAVTASTAAIAASSSAAATAAADKLQAASHAVGGLAHQNGWLKFALAGSRGAGHIPRLTVCCGLCGR
ncbi:hypothetical protein C7I85_29955, partial [Mesorhizobium soli]